MASPREPAATLTQARPGAADAPPAVLGAEYTTPADGLFVRSHGDIPHVDPAAYRLEVRGLVRQPLSLSMEMLRARFVPTTVTALLRCPGPRDGDPGSSGRPAWDQVPEAAGNADWTGARLGDVLQSAGVSPAAAHVAFTGLDRGADGGPRFGGSIPLDKALAGEVLLAYLCNGAPLAPEHGFPLRVLVPGYIGARSVKWVGEVNVQAAPSDSYYQAHWAHFDASEAGGGATGAAAIGPLFLDAVIWEPADGETVPAGPVRVSGYAVAAEPFDLTRVEVSPDDGESWVKATWLDGEQQWGWRRWAAEVRLAPGRQRLAARAWDRHDRTQSPEGRPPSAAGSTPRAWRRIEVEAR
jgi:sulfite oxidase